MNLAQCVAHAQTLGLPRLEAQTLLLHQMGRPLHDRAWLLAHDTEAASVAQLASYESLLQRLLNHEPVAYIVGRKEFFGLNLQIDDRVLDPRADTELLVSWALACCPDPASAPRLLDLGTGSGAIALALQQQRPKAEVWAVDASDSALGLAQHNALALGLPVHFVQSHWLQNVSGQFHVLVSNPPYIAQHDPHLATLQHEPQQALVSGPDGLKDLREIIAQAPGHLHDGGWLLLEHGWDQAAAVRTLLHEVGLTCVQSKMDLAGIERCSGGQKK